MKKIYLMRHAKSSWKDEKLSDHERPLKKRGIKDAKHMAQMLESKEYIPQRIICSTAERAVQTADVFAKACDYKKEITYSDKLYMAEVKDFYEVLKDLPDKVSSVMLIGHNPGMEAFLQVLTKKVESLPTSSIAYIKVPVKSWSELNEEVEGELKKLWRPKEA